MLERIEALREVIAGRPQAIANRPPAKDETNARLVFITQYVRGWAKRGSDNPTAKETVKLLRNRKLHRPGSAFRAPRRAFEKIGGEDRSAGSVRLACTGGSEAREWAS